jgi:DnaJ-domain-containing protein 1
VLRFENRSGYSQQTHLNETIALMAAELIRTGGFNRIGVLAVKNTLLEHLSADQTQAILYRFKHFVQNGNNTDHLYSRLQTLQEYLGYHDRIQILNILYQIVQKRGYFSKPEISLLRNLGEWMGLQFESGFNDAGSQYHSYQRQEPSRDLTDYYRTLGVTRDATVTEIKKKFRALCKQYHPDTVSGKSEAVVREYESKMKEIIHAYNEVLKDKKSEE